MKISTDEELWEILGSKEKFNSFIDSVIEKTIQQCMLTVPRLVIYHIKNEQQYEKLKNNFFKTNPELVNHQDLIANEINHIASEHPEFNMEQIFTEAGLQTKVKLRKLNLEKANG